MRRTLLSEVTHYDAHGKPYRVPTAFVECVYIDDYSFVHAVVDQDESVLAYSVTTRKRNFRPRFRPPGGISEERGRILRALGLRFRTRPLVAIRLASSTFDELGDPQQAGSWVGAHNLHYFEAFYWGNPGHYQTYVFSVNDAGYGAWATPFGAQAEFHDFSWGFRPSDASYKEMDTWRAVRSGTRINTYTVISPALGLSDYPFADGDPSRYPARFGVNSSETRLLTGDG